METELAPICSAVAGEAAAGGGVAGGRTFGIGTGQRGMARDSTLNM